jgi:outer membrane protein TolC
MAQNLPMMNRIPFLIPLVLGFLLHPLVASAQTAPNLLPENLSLAQCIAYALANQPTVKQARIDEQIGEREIRANLAVWLPQISARSVAAHNIKRPVAVFGDNFVPIGTNFNSNVLLQADQTLYSNQALLATRAAQFTRLQLDQNTEDTKINTVVAVSKAFYDILLTQEQLRILDENIARQEKQYRDALARYESGLVDKTDYQRASISLANTRSARKRTQESVKAKQALLKQLMGYPPTAELTLAFDQARMQEQVLLDTTQTVDFTHRIEFKQLQTRQHLLHLNTSFHRWGFLPTVSAYVTYNPFFFSNALSDLYQRAFPTSAVGLQAAIPVFQGSRRIQNLRIAQLQEERLAVELDNTRNLINTEYQTALANYKSDYNEWLTLGRNAQVAEEVYATIKLQYDEGIKTYLDLVVAETDLQAAQINYYNALFRVLESKLDFQRALGTVEVN